MNIVSKIACRLAHDFLAPRDVRRAIERLTASPDLTDDEKSLLGRIPLSVHRLDGMYKPFAAEHYLRVGLSALRAVDAALAASAPVEVRRILDLPSGHGRVCRFLRAEYPDTSITTSDIARGAARHSARLVGGTTVPSQQDLGSLDLGEPYDLIWCGSLVTHLDETQTTALLQSFRRHLAPKGVCVVTAQGEFVAERLRVGSHHYGLPTSAIPKLLAHYEATGYGYADYRTAAPGLGISITSRECVQRVAESVGNWTLTSHVERGWDDHQDVVVLQAPAGDR